MSRPLADAVRALACPHHHLEALRRPAPRVGRGRRRRRLVADLFQRLPRQVGPQAVHAQVARDRDRLAEGQLDHGLIAVRLAEAPGRVRRRQRHRHQPAAVDHQARHGVALARLAGSGGRPPAVEGDGHRQFGRLAVRAQQRRREQVGQSAIETRGGNDGDAGSARGRIQPFEHGHRAGLFGCHVDVVGARADRGLCNGQGGVEEGPRAVDDGGAAGERRVQRRRVVDRGHARRHAVRTHVGAPPHGDRGAAAAPQFGQHEARGVAAGAVDGDRANGVGSRHLVLHETYRSVAPW
jgi:hypothetical protein